MCSKEVKTNLELARRRDDLWGCGETERETARRTKTWKQMILSFRRSFPSRNRLWGSSILTASSFYRTWREPERFFSPSLIKSESQWKRSAHNSPDCVKGAIEKRENNYAHSSSHSRISLRIRRRLPPIVLSIFWEKMSGGVIITRSRDKKDTSFFFMCRISHTTIYFNNVF